MTTALWRIATPVGAGAIHLSGFREGVLHRREARRDPVVLPMWMSLRQHQAGLSATRTSGSVISLHRSRMTAIPSAPQLSGPEPFMLHLRGLRLGHFRFGLFRDT
jgi:hypothetical protein